MKRFKKFLAILLVASMIFTTNAVNVFAEGNKANQEEQLNEESEEATVGDELSEPEEDTDIDENLSEPALDEEEPEAEAEEEAEEATVGANVHGARPEDEENSTGAKLGEPEKIKANTEDKLFGYQGPLDYIVISQYTIKTYHVGDTYDPSDLKIKAYYDDADTEDEAMVEVAYTGNESKFSFNPDCVNIPFTASTTEENPYELEIQYKDEHGGQAFVTTAFQVYPAQTPTESKFCIKYFNITGTNWTSIASREEVHNIINNPIVKEFTASTDTSEVAAAIGTLGYTNGFKKLTKDEYDNYTGIGAATHTSDEEIDNIAKENGVFDQWKLSPTETVYYGINYYYYDAEMNYAENHSSGTWEIYDNTFDWNTDLSPHELVAFHNNDAEEAIVLPQVTVKGSDTYKMRNTSTGDIQYIWTWALQPDGMQERSFGDTENAWPFKPETKTLTLYAQWYGDTPTPPGPTPKPTPTPTPSPSNSGSSSGGSGGGGSSDPTHGPMGDLTKNPLYANALNNISVNNTNYIPQSSLVNNNGLYVQLKSMQENANTSFNNAKDSFGNVGYGQWLRVPNTTTWYFYSGDLSQATNGQTQGFLSNGWFNLGWDGQDRWYHFDGSGVMQLGWYQEAGKTYFLQNDINDNWYGKAVTGTQNIGGRIYNFDANGALIN